MCIDHHLSHEKIGIRSGFFFRGGAYRRIDIGEEAQLSGDAFTFLSIFKHSGSEHLLVSCDEVGAVTA
jgi:hypothetical protein